MLAHLELAERDALARGLDPLEARREARRQFGGVEQMKEAHRDDRSARWIENLLKDVRYGLAGLRREPGFALVAIGVLALGIGANTAMFSVVDGALLKPLPFPAPERVVRMWEAADADQRQLDDGAKLSSSSSAGCAPSRLSQPKPTLTPPLTSTASRRDWPAASCRPITSTSSA